MNYDRLKQEAHEIYRSVRAYLKIIYLATGPTEKQKKTMIGPIFHTTSGVDGFWHQFQQ